MRPIPRAWSPGRAKAASLNSSGGGSLGGGSLKEMLQLLLKGEVGVYQVKRRQENRPIFRKTAGVQ